MHHVYGLSNLPNIDWLDIDRLEAVERKFLKYVHFKWGRTLEEFDSLSCLVVCNTKLLEYKRKIANLCFTFRLINGKLNCQRLLSSFVQYVSTNDTKHKNAFATDVHSRNYNL